MPSRGAKIAKAGAITIGGIFSLAIKIIAALLLIIVTTGAIFTCIFVMYIKANLTTGLDVNLEEFSMSLSSVIYARNPESGQYEEMTLIKTTEYRTWVDYADIPENMEHALVAIEDKRFYRHHGVDWYRTSAAFVNMFLGMKGNFGGSTITQQLIKTMTGDNEATIQRKLTEIFRALEFEKNNDKDRIIVWYLNSVYFGNMRYGIGAAANYYFGKDVHELSLAECASIVGITNNPSMYDPYQNKAANKRRQEDILNVMYTEGYITAEERDRAKSERLLFKKGEESTYTPEDYTWFDEAVISDAIAVISEMKGVDARTASVLLSRGGYQIYSTIDLRVQALVDQIYQDLEKIPQTRGSQQQLQSAIVIVEPGTSNIVALSGGVGVKEGNRLRNRATVMRRPPGSSIKPLSVYSLAMERGLLTPDTLYDDAPGVKLSGTDWYPRNSDPNYMGVITIRTAVVRSRNTISAQVLDKLTPSVSYRFMREKLGIDLNAADSDYAPLALGQLTYGATVREMASAFNMFVSDGVRTDSRTFTTMCDADGEVIYDGKPDSEIAISASTAYWMTDMLRDAVRYGTGSGASLGDAMPVAGKTGTTEDDKDRWFVGFTPYYTAAVWTGYDQPEAIKPVVNMNPAARIWREVMGLIHEDLPYKDFAVPANTYQPPVTGVVQVGYTVICMDNEGNILGEDRGQAPVGEILTFTAPEFDGFIPEGESYAELTVGSNPERNAVIFKYAPIADEATPTPTPDESGEPPTPPTDPGATPAPTPPDAPVTPPDWLPAPVTPTPVPSDPSDEPPYYTPNQDGHTPSPTETPTEIPGETPGAAPML